MIREFVILLIVIYIIINCISLYLFYADKRKAVKGSYRTKELTLLLAGVFGPFGAVIGMHAFRHKVRKAKFKVIYIFLFMHTLRIVLWLIYI
jgi:uncharacterized membrane protein YsdA (DUF1294 family)